MNRYSQGTYTAAQMMDVALTDIGRMTMQQKLRKKCLTCSRREKMDWTLSEADARHHLDRSGYEKHVIVDVEKEEKKGDSK